MRNDELVRSSFDAFLRGDWDKLSEVMDAGVHWLGYEPGGCDCHGRKQVLATLFDRRREGVVTGLNAVVAVDERVFVEVTGPRLTEWGPPGGQACMVVTVRDGRIVRMQDYPDRAAARAGAGLPPDPSADGSEAADELSVFPPLLRPDAPLARRVTETIRTGDAAALEQLLREHPTVAGARTGDARGGQSRTLLHLVTDWPGRVPDAGAKIRALVAAGADVNARFIGPHSETPLHWAASSDDVEALDALLDAGADIEADGAVIGAAPRSPTRSPSASGTPPGGCSNAAPAPPSGRPPRSGSSTASSTSSNRPRRAARTSTMRCGAPPTAANAKRPSCCWRAVPIRRG
jgi:ketosteroid isomerase-like protein